MKAADWIAATGIERGDAVVLLRELAGVARTRLLAHPDLALGPDAVATLDAAAARLRAGEPLAYVLGRREFWGLEYEVGPGVLVPRPETELLVELALRLLPPESPARVLDLGCGSGAIAIAVAHERPRAEVWAVDTSAEALAVASRNALRLLGPGRLRLLRGDWFAALPDDAPRFDLVLSNPPYVAAGDPHLAALSHEPALALVGGRASADGLDEIRAIVAAAPRHLAPGATLAIEHGWDQGPAVRALLEQAGLRDAHTLRDLAGIDRVGVARHD